MSLPVPQEPGQGGRWETIRYALDTNPRTFRLCLILSVAAVAPCLAIVIAELMRHMLLCGARSRPGQSYRRDLPTDWRWRGRAAYARTGWRPRCSPPCSGRPCEARLHTRIASDAVRNRDLRRGRRESFPQALCAARRSCCSARRAIRTNRSRRLLAGASAVRSHAPGPACSRHHGGDVRRLGQAAPPQSGACRTTRSPRPGGPWPHLELSCPHFLDLGQHAANRSSRVLPVLSAAILRGHLPKASVSAPRWAALRLAATLLARVSNDHGLLTLG
jgi:hypothetical protein